jgi:hypothetical protein
MTVLQCIPKIREIQCADAPGSHVFHSSLDAQSYVGHMSTKRSPLEWTPLKVGAVATRMGNEYLGDKQLIFTLTEIPVIRRTTNIHLT